MTTTRHTFTATLLGDEPVDLHMDQRGARIVFDSGRAPHVTARNVSVWADSADTIAALDPRESPRVRLDVKNGETTIRTFDLGVRGRVVSQSGTAATLTLASDEAILADVRALTDNTSPLTRQNSLRALVNGVLSSVIPGAHLDAATSAPDVAVPALADSSNLIRNSRVGTGTTDWRATWASGGLTPLRQAANGPAYAPTYMAYLSNANVLTNGAEIFIGEEAVSISTGKQYVLSVSLGGATGRQLILDAVCFDSSGNITGFVPATTATMLAAGAWQRVSTVPFEAYPNTARIRVRVRAAVLGGSEYVNVTAWRLSETTGDLASDITYYDGATADTAQYDYAWQQTAFASISTRKVKVDAATPEGLTWRAGQTALEFLQPIVQRFGLRLVCDEARVWTLRDEDYTAPGSLMFRHGVNLGDADDTIDRDSGYWYDARLTRYRWRTPDGVEMTRDDTFALNTPPSRVDLLEVNAAYPGPGRSEYAVRRAQQRGREVTATMSADWTARVEQPVSIRLDKAPIQTGKTQTVTFDLGENELTITSRTTDTPEHAWILQAAQRWTGGPVGQSWTEAP